MIQVFWGHGYLSNRVLRFVSSLPPMCIDDRGLQLLSWSILTAFCIFASLLGKSTPAFISRQYLLSTMPMPPLKSKERLIFEVSGSNATVFLFFSRVELKN